MKKNLVRSMTLTIAVVAAGCLLSACAEEIAESDPRIPQVVTLGTSALTVGEPLEIYGFNFLDAETGTTRLVFEGTYFWMDASGNHVPEKVPAFTIQPLFDGVLKSDGALASGKALSSGTTVLRWNRFGPFKVPFGNAGNRAGVFKGTVRAVNEFHETGEVFNSELVAVSIEIKPSIIITKLEPIVGFENNDIQTAGCDAPAVRGIGGMPYILQVEAMGFVPQYFIYEVANINGNTGWTKLTHQANGPIDTLGDPRVHDTDPPIVFNKLADEEGFAIAAIRVTATDADGNAYHTALPLTVVRPLGFHYDGNYQLAEYYPPVPVHGPVVGSIKSTLSYSESHSESRQQGVSMVVSSSWTASQGKVNTESWSEGVSNTASHTSTNVVGQSHSESESASETFGTSYGSSESNSLDYSTKQGSNWGWNATSGQSEEEYNTKMGEIFGSTSAEVSASVTGEGSVPGFAKVSGTAGTKVGAEIGAKTGTTTGEKVATSEEFGNHMYESDEESTAFGSVTTDTQSQSVGGSYGLSSQSTINSSTSESNANSESTTYQMGGSGSLSENVSKGSQESWSETWVSTTQDTTLLSYSTAVPRGRCAVVYRQTVRWVRQAQLYSYDLCGVRSLVGELTFNEWSWSPNISIGSNCDQDPPPSTQPKAACFVACE